MRFQSAFSFWSMVILLGLAFQRTVWAQEVLDQEHAPSGNFGALAVATDRTQIQTFTVGVTGVLTRIDVQVSKGSETAEDLVLSLWSTDITGLPKELLATASLPPSAISLGNRVFTAFDISSDAVGVAAGEVLAIVLNSNVSNIPPFEERYEWEIGDQYNRGKAFTIVGPSLFEQSEDFHFKTFVDSEILQVSIDIKPKSFPNIINPRSKGKIPVGILTSEAFDATTVDPTTVLLGPTGTEAASVQNAFEDVNGDGNTDLILHFNTQNTGIKCGDISAILTGETFEGQKIRGFDSIKTVGCKRN